MKRVRKRSKPRPETASRESTFFPGIQAKLKVGTPGDRYEVEADKMADKVVAGSDRADTVQKMEEDEGAVQQKPLAESVTTLHKGDLQREAEPLQRMEEEEAAQAQEEEEAAQMQEEEEAAQAQEEEEAAQMQEEEEAAQAQEEEEAAQAQEEEEAVQAKTSASSGSKTQISNTLKNSKGGGSPLDTQVRGEMEHGFGVDFSNIRIHTGSQAGEMSSHLRAQAFTHGNHIYFNQGKYNPDSKKGKHLLAHELTHTIQQGAAGNFIQPKLTVDDKYPQKYVDDLQDNPKGTDPSKSLSTQDRLKLVKTQLGKISPDFSVKATGDVTPTHSKSEDELKKGSKGTGSCCMHVLTRPKSNNWNIIVSDHFAPHTNEDRKTVHINSNLNPLQFGAHNKKGDKLDYSSNPEIILGHELCGHASLMEIGAHAEGQRATSQVHDSTIKLENEIAKGVGKKGDQLRGFASDGPHKGESFGQGLVINYGFNKTSISHLDQSERDKLTLISDVIRRQDLFVELRGHSDNVGSESAKQKVSDRRAKNAFLFLRKLGVSRKAEVELSDTKTIKVNRNPCRPFYSVFKLHFVVV